ncbi:uncharacterized protein [Anas platyrhynchos]|uniref:uncharacterized protein isoform X3 n=1 Tax=Anas platyrhynchos TaxID=8839 RepID=UPI000F7C33B4|eukprot:XP_027328956.1 uncharacterized protein LOC101801823 [Anas platyrhynchos]
MKKTQQQQIRRCELCYAHSGIIRNFTMRTERSCSFSISVPITILSRRHHKIKKLCSDILNMICSEVISSAFHTGKDRRRARKCAAAGEKKEKRRKVISSAFAVASLAPAQDGPGFPAQLLAHTENNRGRIRVLPVPWKTPRLGEMWRIAVRNIHPRVIV